MPRKKTSHIHQYQKVEWGKNGTIVWRCVLPGCSHYLHDQFIDGKRSLCNECRAVFIMNKDKMRRKKPKCDRCQMKKDPIAAKFDSLLEGL